MAKPTLSAVAAQAGVSEATASRVLNAKPGVSAETRQAVLTALDVLGYERPLALRHKSAGLIGLVVPELTNPVFPAYAQTIESLLAQRGYTPVLCTQTPGGVSEDEYVEMLLARGVAGIIFIAGLHADLTADTARYTKLIDQGLPLVCINGYRPEVSAPFVSADDEAAVQLAVSHLVSMGHRRIGFATGQHRFAAAAAKVDAFEKAGVDLADTQVATTLFTVEGGHAAALGLIDAGMTGIVCGSDLMALGAIRAARQRGLGVPTDLSVVGFDDSPLMAFTEPPLTTVRQPVGAMSAASVEMLVGAIIGDPSPASHYLFAPELVVRGSTGACHTA